MIVDFVYDSECPNVQAARGNMMRAFSRMGVPARWREHRIGDPEVPDRVRGYGSPSVLVDGLDVAGQAPTSDACCRLYSAGGVPGVELIAAALEVATVNERDDGHAAMVSTGDQVSASAESGRGGWRSSAAVLPGIGVALMPKLVCPLCWPAYAGVLSATGLTFLMEDRWLLPISGVFLCAALAGLAWRATSRRGYGPLYTGAVAALIIMVGKFAFDWMGLVYLGIAVLTAACAWNAWPRRTPTPACSACRGPAVT